ncbi:MAG: SRPBCC family protein [Deltaproteobacteria bacterium]|nr:SRPBCC family protein [Deltaproteobacteria bacterium]
MAKACFTIRVDVGAEPERVHGLLSDLHALRVLHPLIEEVQDLEPDPEHPEAHRYRVIDRIPMGPIRLRAAYTATLWAVSPKEVRGTAEQFPRIRLDTTYHISKTKSGTQLNETVHLTAPRPLCSWVRRHAEAAHRAMLDRLKTHLESTTGVTSELG